MRSTKIECINNTSDFRNGQIYLFLMRLHLWIAFFLSIFIDTVNCRLLRRARVKKNAIVEQHRRKLIKTDHEDGISGSYIVHFQDYITNEEVVQKANELATETGGKISWIYKEIFKGFTISGLDSDDHIATILGRDDIKVMDQVRFL